MKDDKIHRTNGQLWIDKNSPFRLKYKVNDNIYSVDVSPEYEVSIPMAAGQVVSFSYKTTSDDKIIVSAKKAIFPDDIENVIGVIGQTVNKNETTPILKTGIIELTREDIEKSFIDLDEYVSDHETDYSYYVGAPVYWFIGKINRTGEGTIEDPFVYSYVDSSDYPGTLTLKTPSGNKWKLDNTKRDDSLNVGYDNLPIVGNVVSYSIGDVYHVYKVPEEDIGKEITGDYYVYEDNQYVKATGVFKADVTYYTKKIQFTSMKIHLNISKFDSSLEWNWPYMCNNECGTRGPEENKKPLIIRHGLFAFDEKDNNSVTKMVLRPRNYCDIVALSTINDDEFVVNAGIENYYGQTELEPGSKDRRTEIYLSTPETFRYRISGRVNYKFDKKHGEN